MESLHLEVAKLKYYMFIVIKYYILNINAIKKKLLPRHYYYCYVTLAGKLFY